MNIARRRFLHLTATAAVIPAVLPALSGTARAEDAYPSRPVHLIVFYAAGGGNDIIARLMGQWLSQRLGQSFVIENRPGGGGNIGTEYVARAAADGYTLILSSTANVVNASLYPNLSFDFLRDFAPVASISYEPNIMVVNPSVPAKTVPEFIAYAKANPGKLNFGSAGIGSSQQMSGEMFKMMAGVEMTHVPFRGTAPALTALLGNQVQLMFGSMPATLPYVKSGKLRALAVTTAKRSDALPDVPTVGEFLPGFDASVYYGICAPKNTPAAVIDKLNKEINAGLADPGLKKKLLDLGSTVLPGSPADFGKFLANETEKWAKVVKFAHIKAE
ncbi:MAG TPA: tripartite tricarboxylate transporter substrate binding protein [Xanthobacteraceae bacterium]|nr:tripartite tricarboxylate transporter substrate binding protein [Xanthobacteraceae bacterium]